MSPRPLALCLALALAAGAAPSFAADAPAVAQAQSDKAARLNTLYDEYWEENLKLNPLQATQQGDTRYNDQLPDILSAQYRAQSLEFTQRWLKTVKAVGTDGLSGQDLLSYEIFVRDAEQDIDGERFPDWQQPINQFRNLANFAVQFGSGAGAQPFKTVKDYDNWLARAKKLPTLFDTAAANMRQGIKEGVVQPRVLMTKVLVQLDNVIKEKPEDTLFWLSLIHI